MKKSWAFKFIQYCLSFLLVIVLVVGAFVYWAVGQNLPRESDLPIDFVNSDKVYLGKDEIKVATYNIGHSQGVKENAWDYRDKETTLRQLDLLAKAISSMDADVLLLQEVDVDSNRTHRINQIDYLQKKTQYPYYACANVWEKNYVPFPYFPVNHHIGYVRAANCVMSKYPLSNHHRIIFDKPKENPFWYNWGYIDRGLQKVDVQIGPHQVAIVNVHLEAWGKHTREVQIKVVKDYLASFNKPVILGGDFNTIPDSAEQRCGFPDEVHCDYEDEKTLSSLLTLAPDIKMGEFKKDETSIYTFPSDSPDRQLDHIFLISPRLSFMGFRVFTKASLASDHLPVIAEIKLNMD